MIQQKERNDIRVLKNKVIKQIYYKAQSRKDLIDFFMVRPNTISTIINELKEEKKIVEDKVVQTGGRPLVQFKINNHYNYYGGIMIEGERIQGTLIGYAGEVIYTCQRNNPQDLTGEALINNIKFVIRSLINHSPGGDLKKIKICGSYFSNDGRYFSSGYVEYEKPIEVFPELNEEFNLKLFTGSGIGAMVMAEKMIGKNTDNFIYVHFGAGILISIVDNGIKINNDDTIGGELGHTRSYSNKKCRCGRIGCLETVASVWAIKEYLKENPDLLTKDQWIHLDTLTVSDVMELYLELCLVKKNEQVINHLRSMSRALGIAVRNTLDLVVRRQVILSGFMMKAADIIIPVLEDEIFKSIFLFERQPVSVVISKLDMYAPSQGAAMFLLAEEILHV